MNYNYDPNTISTNYKVQNETVRIFKTNQVVTLRYAAFKSTVQVLESSNGQTTDVTSLYCNFQEDDRLTEDAIQRDPSQAYVGTDPLVISFLYNKEIMAQTTLIISYVTWEDITQTTSDYSIINQLQDSVEALLHQRSPLNLDDIATFVDPILNLDVDLDGTNDTNHVIDESHIVNTTAGYIIIQPGAGSFYESDDFVLERVDINEPTGSVVLVKDVDYKLISMNAEKTAHSHTTMTVYDAILMLSPVNAEHLITYHAYGGTFSRLDGTNTKRTLQLILQWLKGNQFLTNSTLPNTEAYKKLVDDITALSLRFGAIALENGAGSKSTYTVNAIDTDDETTAGYWVPIAKLYQDIDGNPVYGDTGIFSINVTHPMVNYNLRIQVNADMRNGYYADPSNLLHLPGHNALHVKVLNGYNPVPLKDFEGDLTKIEQQWIPQFRVVYERPSVQGDGSLQYSTKGMVLQMYIFSDIGDTGISLDIDNQFSITVVNESPNDSSWTLYSSTTISVGRTKNGIVTLPDASDGTIITTLDSDPATGVPCWIDVHLAPWLDGAYWMKGAVDIASMDFIPSLYRKLQYAFEGEYIHELILHNRFTGKTIHLQIPIKSKYVINNDLTIGSKNSITVLLDSDDLSFITVWFLINALNPAYEYNNWITTDTNLQKSHEISFDLNLGAYSNMTNSYPQTFKYILLSYKLLQGGE